MTPSRRPPIVAELGRPETPEETAERKAATSRRHREGQTLLNLVVALVAALIAVLVVVLVTVRPDIPAAEPIPYQSVAADSNSDVALAAPTLPEGWAANSARFSATADDGVSNWYIGFITPEQQFLALRQGIDANPTWVANQIAPAKASGTTVIEGVTWTLYDRRDVANAGNIEYAMTAEGSTSSFVLFGTASDAEFKVMAMALTTSIKED